MTTTQLKLKVGVSIKKGWMVHVSVRFTNRLKMHCCFENTGRVNLIKAETITIKAPKRGEEM